MIEGPILVLGGAYLLVLALRAAAALVVLRRDAPTWVETASVTIVQPILSGDPALEATLKTNLDALGHLTFFWLVDEGDEEALRIAARLGASHPGVRLVVHRFPPPPEGVNPKTFKLAGVWPQIATEVAVVLDDDTVLSAADLDALIGGLGRGDLSTVLPHARPGGSGPSRLLGQFVENNAVLTYLAPLAVTEPLTINGMGWAVRVASWDRWGGWEPLLRQLTDDLAVATQVRQHGGKLVQTLAHAQVGTSLASWGSYFRQMHRWFLFASLLLVQESRGRRFVLTVLHGAPPLVLLGLLGVLTLGIGPSGAVVGAVVLLRAAILILVQWVCTGRVGYRPLLSELSEVLQSVHLVHSLVVRTITWRTRRYLVKRNDGFLVR